MKRWLSKILCVVVTWAIAQPVLADVLVFKVAGIQIKKLPPDIDKAVVECAVTKRDGSGVTYYHAVKVIPTTQSQDGREIVSGPFEITFTNVPNPSTLSDWQCNVLLQKGNEPKIQPVICTPDTAVTGPHICIDKGKYNKVSVRGTFN